MKALYSRTIVAGVALAAGLLLASPAQAQMTWTDKGFANVNFGVQGGSSDLATTSTFELYGENGSLSTTQETGGGALFDVSVGYKVWKNLALGIGYSRSGGDADAAVAASVPDPVFFDRPRSVTGVASGLDRSENAVHISGTWMMPVTDKVDVGFSFGPTFFNVSQELPTAITVTEPGPAIADTTVVKESESAVGINLGIDVTYLVTKRIGAGVLLRYTWGSVDFPGATDSVSVGGLQLGFGARIRF